MLVKFELLIVYNVNTLNFIWLIKGFVYTSFVVMEHISYRHLDSYFNIWIYGVHSVCVIYFRYRIKIAR